MKQKSPPAFLAAVAVASLLAVAGLWLKISVENPARAAEEPVLEKTSAAEAARQILSTLPATTGRGSGFAPGAGR